MPHGMFINGRRADNLVRPSGFMQLDIDTKHNPRLCVDEIKRRAVNDSSIILIAKSAGSGCWGLVRREADGDAQLDRIESILGVTLDRCNSRSVAALRFASSDPEPYLKP